MNYLQKKYLVILDELFKGTNTIERISINASILKELAKRNYIILSSTHDRELTELLSEQYEFYHFSEIIKDNTLLFDYKIKRGIATEGNAIKILKISGYPEAITNEAERIKDRKYRVPSINR